MKQHYRTNRTHLCVYFVVQHPHRLYFDNIHREPKRSSNFRRHHDYPYNSIFLHIRRSNIVGYVGGRMIHISMCNTCKTSMTLPPTTSAYGKRIFVDIMHIRIIFDCFPISTSIFISSEIILRGYSKINMKMNFWENIE